MAVDKVFDLRPGREIAGQIFEALHKRANSEAPRLYLGMSEIGDPCTRRLWLKYHGVPREPVSGQLARIFHQGNLTEAAVMDDLLAIGIEVGGAQREFQGREGRFRGHCDGVAVLRGQKHILEIKSANNASFEKFVKDGIACNRKYLYQVQCYMSYSSIMRALFIVENKNNQDLYTEVVKYDEKIALEIEDIADRITTQRLPDDKVANTNICFRCEVKDSCNNPETWPDLAGKCYDCEYFRDYHTRQYRSNIALEELKAIATNNHYSNKALKNTDLIFQINQLYPEKSLQEIQACLKTILYMKDGNINIIHDRVNYCGHQEHPNPLKKIGSCKFYAQKSSSFEE